MRHELLTIETRQDFPAKVDVAIIGGGAGGVATAYALHKKGVEVAVLEKGWVAAEQSSRNWGWCRTLGRDIRELEMAKLSVELWRNLQKDTGIDAGFRETGVVFVTDDPKEMDTWERWLATAAKHDVPATMLTADQANASHAWQDSPWIGGIRTERDGYAEPSRAIPLLAKYLNERGVHILQQCAANELLIEGGRVVGVQTERGPLRANHVVIAGGAWSSLLCRKHGISLPILQVYSSASRSLKFDTGGKAPARATRFSFRPHEDGGLVLAKSGRGRMHMTPDCLRYGIKFLPMYKIRKANVGVSLGKRFLQQWWTEMRYFHLNSAPFTTTRVLDPEPDMALVSSAYRDAAEKFPGLGEQHIQRAWGGVIDNTPDGIPVISDVKSMPGLFLCTGFSGHGFSSSMGAGHVLAERIVDGKFRFALEAFSHERLIDGRKLQPSILY